MGIERFFRSIEENKITNLKSNFTKTLEKRVDTDKLYIDFNSIVYITRFKVLSDLNYLLYQIIKNNNIVDKKVNKIVEEYELSEEISGSVDKLTKIDIDNIILDKVFEYIFNILENYVDPHKLNFLYIAIDGVPTKSKIVEQRKRRYMGGIIGELEKKIFDKYKDELKKDKHRHIYETHKITWSQANITPGTVFMDKLNKLLYSIDFELTLKETCPNLRTYIYSGPYEPGEGEKKIVDHIRSQQQVKTSSTLIYSPDSDVTLLALLLHTNGTENLKLLRHNQQKDNYDVVDIDMLADNLFIYINIQMEIKKIKLDKNSIINDVVFLLTIFGNDFLPKIDAFNVKQDFDRIIDKYTEVIIRTKKNLIKKGKPTVNQQVFLEILKELKMDEGGNLQKMYMAANYQNYDKLKKIMGADQTNFTQVLNEFLDKLRLFNKQIVSNKIDIDRWVEDDTFMKVLKQLARLEQVDPRIDNKKFIIVYINYYKETNKLPQVRIMFRRYLKSLRDSHHKERLEKSLHHLDPKLKVTKYDEEIYKFQNMLDEYADKLNASSLNLGYVGVDPNTYTWKTEKVETGVKRYYKEFFDIDDINIKNKKMQKVVSSYIEGLMWVFEFYFSNFDIKENRDYADTWYYNYSHAPLLTQIYSFMEHQNKNYLQQVQKDLIKYKVKRDAYFNSLEHLMYVTPVPLMLDLIPDEYNKFSKSVYYPNFNSMVDDMWSSKKELHLIDCRGVIFLSKCHMGLENWTWSKDRQFLKDLRAIELNKETKDRTGKVMIGDSNVRLFEFPKMTTTMKIKQKGPFKKIYNK